MSAHTPGPWLRMGFHIYAAGESGANVASASEPRASTTVGYNALTIGSKDADEADANARLIAAAPDLLASTEAAYILLGGNRNSWPGRCSADGQALLNSFRDAICKATGRDAQDVQDDYCNRAAIAKAQS